jgi:pSer/pThr/pTyr-binding forkhead associated (FHA) protein
MEAPVTIGREEGNTIQLNDERVSRYHLKIQKDHDDLVLTDLQSTNGSRVNNEEVQLKILRSGDLITIGRSVLLFGDREDIKNENADLSETPMRKSSQKAPANDENLVGNALDRDAPKLPERLSPGQAAQLSEVIEYLHLHLRHIISDAEITQRGPAAVQLPKKNWQEILELQAQLAQYIDLVGKPTT